MIHELKILSKYYRLVELGIKTFEIRYDDREYKVGDILILREYHEGKYTGRQIIVEVIVIIRNCIGVEKGYVILINEIKSYDKDE